MGGEILEFAYAFNLKVVNTWFSVQGEKVDHTRDLWLIVSCPEK